MPRKAQVTDPRLSWIPPLDDQPVRRSHKRKATPWTASRSASTAGTTLDQPTEADVKRELALLRETRKEYERTEDLKQKVEKWAEEVKALGRHNEIKAANRRLLEEMANYRHKSPKRYLATVPNGLNGRLIPKT